MKALFISYYQAFHDEIIEILDQNAVRGYTYWEEVRGRGSHTGSPHLGTHAWPELNSALLTFVPSEKVASIVAQLKVLDESIPQQGLRAFVLDAQDAMA